MNGRPLRPSVSFSLQGQPSQPASPAVCSPVPTCRSSYRLPGFLYPVGICTQGRRLPPLRGTSFRGIMLSNLHDGGEILKRGYSPLEAFQLGWVKGGEEFAIFPSLVSFSFPLSLGQARERGSFPTCMSKEKMDTMQAGQTKKRRALHGPPLFCALFTCPLPRGRTPGSRRTWGIRSSRAQACPRRR